MRHSEKRPRMDWRSGQMGRLAIQRRGYKSMPKKQRKPLGRYIVADPEVCHGKPTFVGTRIMVAQVLKQVAKGMPWDAITAVWDPGELLKRQSSGSSPPVIGAGPVPGPP